MKKPRDPRTDQIKHTEKQPTDPGPTSGGMGSMGSRSEEPSLEEKLGMEPKAPVGPQYSGPAAKEGIPGFHTDPAAEQRVEGSGGPATPAGMRLDPDTNGRVDTGTGDQPGNTGGSRTGTPPDPADATTPQAPDNSGSTAVDMDQERGGGMSGGLGEEE